MIELKFIYPRWGSATIAWPLFLEKIKEHGYDAVEIDLPFSNMEKKEILAHLKNSGLDFIGQHYQTKEVNYKKHKELFKRHLYNLAEKEPLLINSHTGMDFFSFAQNVELIELAHFIEEDTGIQIAHETHRSRFCFAAHICFTYLKELPFLKLTSDFSHWTCVAESLLENQEEAVQMAIDKTLHLHARVGSSQSPQVIDPRDVAYEQELAKFKMWWEQIIKKAIQSKRPFLTLMPEHGPFPYASYQPYTSKVMADQWEVNQFIKSELLNIWDAQK